MIIIGSIKYFSNLEKFIIDEDEYVIFKLKSRKQNDIVNLEEKIDKRWIPSTNYNIKSNLKIELYNDEGCYIYLPKK